VPNTSWLESLSPWPEEFGLDRIRTLLAELGEPQLAYPSIHVVGTNGKTTTVRLTEALLAGQGLAVGSFTSPHVTTWAERIRVGGEEADIEAALARVREPSERLGATQFEVLTAAALMAFAETPVEVAIVEAGLGGRYDATNVLRSPVQVLTNVALEHTDVLGDTREQIAAEKLAVVSPRATVVLGEGEWEPMARDRGAATVHVVSRSNLALAQAAAMAFLGRPVDVSAADGVQVPGRLEQRGDASVEVWDGAHNLAGVGYLLARLPARRYVIVASILADKDIDGMLAALSTLGETFVATRSTNPRSLSARELAAHAARRFASVEVVDEPERAVARGRELAGTDRALLVTGSLYLLADLFARGPAVIRGDVT
jgi:dihydrofolate synthase/folylpolyglutamate synthase